MDETRYLLQEHMIRGIYDDMVMVDQSLRGRGNPKKVLLRNIEDKLERFDAFVVGEVKVTQRLLNRSRKTLFFKYFFFFFLGLLVMFILAFLDQLYFGTTRGGG